MFMKHQSHQGVVMDIELLRGFVTLAMKRNFSLAAKALYISQPTLSRRIVALEKELGCKLINRTVPLTLTEIGERLLTGADDTVSAYDVFRSNASEMKRSEKRIVVLQDRSYSGPMHDTITRCERNLVRRYSELTFKHMECPSGKDIWTLIENGDLDICFVDTFGPVGSFKTPKEHEGVAFAPISQRHSWHPCFIWNKDNPFLQMSPTQLSDFQNIKFLAIAEEYLADFRECFSSFCEEYGGFRPRFDYKLAQNHKYFYSEEPEASVYIIGCHKDSGADNGTIPAGMMEQMDHLVFDDFIIRPFAIYNKRTADDVLLAFVEELSRES
jgi:hypothetical protein